MNNLWYKYFIEVNIIFSSHYIIRLSKIWKHTTPYISKIGIVAHACYAYSFLWQNKQSNLEVSDQVKDGTAKCLQKKLPPQNWHQTKEIMPHEFE